MWDRSDGEEERARVEDLSDDLGDILGHVATRGEKEGVTNLQRKIRAVSRTTGQSVDCRAQG